MKQSSKKACRLANKGYSKVTVNETHNQKVTNSWSSMGSLFQAPTKKESVR